MAGMIAADLVVCLDFFHLEPFCTIGNEGRLAVSQDAHKRCETLLIGGYVVFPLTQQGIAGYERVRLLLTVANEMEISVEDGAACMIAIDGGKTFFAIGYTEDARLEDIA